MREKFSDDIIKLDTWVKKAMAYQESLTNISEKTMVDKLLTDAKSEIKRKVDTLKSLIEPMITAATYQTRMINELTPILKNMLYAELKTMVGVNSFKNAANMMIALKESIVEIQKLNIQNTNEAIVDILKSTKTNLLSAKYDDFSYDYGHRIKNFYVNHKEMDVYNYIKLDKMPKNIAPYFVGDKTNAK